MYDVIFKLWLFKHHPFLQASAEALTADCSSGSAVAKLLSARFPDRSKVIYSERQKQAQKRFSEAVDFARVVIKEPGLKDIYCIKASLLGFRSAWNLAIAEFMSDKPLEIKKKKIRFDRSILTRSLRWNIPVKLYKFAEEPDQTVLKVPPRVKMKRLRDPVQHVSPVLARAQCH